MPKFVNSLTGGMDANIATATVTTLALTNAIAQAKSHASPDTDSATTALHHTLGTGVNQAVSGTDARLSDARTPVAHNQAASTITSGTLDIARIPTGTTGTTVPFGNDARFSDARTPSNDSNIVHITGAETVTGEKTLSSLRIAIGYGGIGSPLFTIRSTGTIFVVKDALAAASSDYAIGYTTDALWFGTATDSTSFKWYGGTQVAATLTGLGALTTVSTITGTTLNGTTGINTGAGAGTQRIDASGNASIATATVTTLTLTNAITQAKSHASPDTDSATTALHHTLGTGVNQAVSGTDARLSDARTPVAHNQDASTITSGTLVVGRGGTGGTVTPAAGSVIYGVSTSAYGATAAGSTGSYLRSGGTGSPTWRTKLSIAPVRVTASSAATSGTTELVIATAAALTPSGSQSIEIAFSWYNVTKTVTTDVFVIRLYDGATAGSGTLLHQHLLTIGANSGGGYARHVVTNPANSAHTYTARLVRTGGTGTATLYGAATASATLTINETE